MVIRRSKIRKLQKQEKSKSIFKIRLYCLAAKIEVVIYTYVQHKLHACGIAPTRGEFSAWESKLAAGYS